MASLSFTCPNCAKILRLAQRPAPGKKIRCPGCKDVFVPELDAEEDEAIEEDRPKAKVNAAPDDDSDEEDEAPPRKKVRTRDDDDDDDRPRRKKARDDDDDVDDDDDRPRKKKKGKSGARQAVMMLLIMGGVTLVLLGGAAFVVTGWFWPGFMIAATNNNDIQTYIPVYATDLIGMNTGAVGQQNQLDAVLKLSQNAGPFKDRPLPPEAVDLMRNSEKVIIATQAVNMRNLNYVAILAKDTAAVDTFKAALGNAERLDKRHIIYRTGKKGGGWPGVVAVPGNRLVLLNDLTDDPLLELLKRGIEPGVGECPALKYAKAVEQAPIWSAWTPAPLPKNFKQAAALMGPAVNMKGGNLAAEFANERWKFKVSIECANEADAKGTLTAIDGIKGMLALGGGLPPTLTKDLSTYASEAQGAMVSIRIELSTQAMEDFAKGQIKEKGFKKR